MKLFTGKNILLGTVCVALLSFLFFKTRELDLAEHGQFDGQWRWLKQLDIALNQDVLKARFRLLGNYDSYSELLRELDATLKNLKTIPAFVEPEDRAALRSYVENISRLVAEKSEWLEEFKSQNAVLNNSLRYFPLAGSELIKRISAAPEDHELEMLFNELLRQVLVYNLNASGDLSAEIQSSLEGLSRWRAEHPAHAEAAFVATMMAHAKSILTRKPKIDVLTEKLILQPTGQRMEEALQLYEKSFSVALRAVSFYRRFLWLTCVLLTAGIAGAVGALRRANTNLERRVQERTSELQRGNAELYREILERQQADQALCESERRHRELVQALPAAIYTCDARGRVTFYNAAAAALWGREPELEKDLWCGSWKIFEADGRAIPLEECPMAVTMREGQPIRGKEIVVERPDGTRFHVLPHPNLIRDASGAVIGAVNMLMDLTERKRAELKLEIMHKELLETSRQAGMAEVATGVLHNVGNVLNSVNVSATLVAEQLSGSRVADLSRVVGLLQEHAGELEGFLSRHPKGQKVPAFLAQLAERLGQEQRQSLLELEGLCKNIEHIKDIVAMQQSYAKVSGVTEVVSVTELIEDTLRMNSGSFLRHDLEVVREFGAAVPPITTEKHKVLQILVNLVRNAKHACDDSGRPDKRLVIGVAQGENRVRIWVRDNGVGISPENLTRIFGHGFTTKKDGHGFGLHSGALAARELGGCLSVQSDGPGQGAVFTLELPATPVNCNN